ncbi:MAG TPA: aminopeptidase P N-terminal domain-containing protein [Thermoanaerobaculia bacterium]|nr:aminopeptidase P N-terminal domain-containing protein [Thermoanaerobaculia bacterium]
MRLSNPKSKIQNLKSFLVTALWLSAALVLALDFPPLIADKSAFQKRRERFFAKLAPGSVAILHSAPTRLMSNDTDYVYRQDSNFYYLTGIEEPDTTAVFQPGAPDGKGYVLFVRPHDPRREAYEGPRPGPDGAVAAYGADAAFANAELLNRLSSVDPATRTLSGYLAGVERIYLLDGGDAEWAERFRTAWERLRARDMGPATVTDAREIVNEMRVVKDAEEIRFLKRAAEVSARGHILAMKAAAPGKWEFEVQQALDGYCFANGVRRMAYPSIAGSGPNSCSLHWDKSNRQMKDGEVLLNDSGAEYGLYATDITRTYPVNGHFSAEQRAIYEIVLDAQKRAMALVKPGLPHTEIEKTCARIQTEGLVRLGLLSGDAEKLVQSAGHRRFTLHGVSHWVGLDVHDAGRYSVGGQPRALEPGMVFTIEPGIYITSNSQGVDPKWWNIGVRIEDTVLVTPEGYECLSCSAPREIADVERTVQAGRK